MSTNNTTVLIVGGGQAGVATSEHLTLAGIDHVVLEKGRIAERWRTGRWDSLVTNGPAWHDQFPNLAHEGDPDRFPTKDEMAAYFERYADRFDAPIHTGVEVTACTQHQGRSGFTVESTAGTWEAEHVVVATGPFQKPSIPPMIPEAADVDVIHSDAYSTPEALREGGVLVIGAGSSGAQIAVELNQAGREVFLAVGPHERPPRRYRDRDICWWLGVLGRWDEAAPPAGVASAIAMSGASGGTTVDFRAMAEKGITLLGSADGYANGVLSIADDLANNIAGGDASYLELIRQADAWVERTGADLPEQPEAHVLGTDPDCITDPLRELDLAEAGIGTVMWATGFAADYQWLHVPGALDERGRPMHERGISPVPGLHYVGLPWQSRRGSGFIWGCWYDARHVADHIRVQTRYSNYSSPREIDAKAS